MKYVLNIKKGTTVNHPKVGRLKGLVAYEINDSDAEQLKHIINLVVFEEIVFKERDSKKKNGSNISSSKR